MKAIFYNYQTEVGDREDIFESEIKVIPCKGTKIAFPWDEEIYFSEVVRICHCFNLNGEFTHIDIELDTF